MRDETCIYFGVFDALIEKLGHHLATQHSFIVLERYSLYIYMCQNFQRYAFVYGQLIQLL